MDLPKQITLAADVVDQHDSGAVILNIGGAWIHLPKSAIEAAMPAPTPESPSGPLQTGATEAP